MHLNQFAFGALPFSAPKLVVAHSCVLSWWRAVHGEPAPTEWDEYARCVMRGLRGAKLVAAPTQAMLSTLAENYGHRRPQTVLPNGRDAAQFQPAPKRDAVFAAGRFWDEAKNLAALDAAAEQLPWPVRVAGSCSAPWDDAEGLFEPGADYLVARDGGEMRSHLRDVLRDATLARTLAENGRRTILARHTCAHRVDELLAIHDEIAPATLLERRRDLLPRHRARAA